MAARFLNAICLKRRCAHGIPGKSRRSAGLFVLLIRTLAIAIATAVFTMHPFTLRALKNVIVLQSISTSISGRPRFEFSIFFSGEFFSFIHFFITARYFVLNCLTVLSLRRGWNALNFRTAPSHHAWQLIFPFCIVAQLSIPDRVPSSFLLKLSMSQ